MIIYDIAATCYLYLVAEEKRAIIPWIFICSYLYFAQTKVNTIGLKMTFRKSKFIHNRPGWPPLNFREKCGNTMLLLQKPMLCRRSLNSLWERRLAEEETRSLLLWEITVVCVSSLVLGRIRLETRTCSFSPQSRRALLMLFSQSCTCESVGLPIEYYEPRISRTEFVVPVERKSEPFISCIRLCQASCLVLKTRGVKVKRDSTAQFKHCLPTPEGGATSSAGIFP